MSARPEFVTLTVDDREVQVVKGLSLVEAALAVGGHDVAGHDRGQSLLGAC